MSIDYGSFLDAGGATRNPDLFEGFKKKDNFVNYLARRITEDLIGTENAEEIASRIIQAAVNDVAFAAKISDKVKELKRDMSDETKVRIDALIRSHGIMKPSDFYGMKRTVRDEGTKAAKRGRARVHIRKVPDAIISENSVSEKQKLSVEMIKALSGNRESYKFGGPVGQVFDYLNGKAKLADLTITQENAITYLEAVKLWDHALAKANALNEKNDSFKVTSYDLRTRIGIIGNLSTHIVYTKSLLEDELKEWDHLEKQSSWVPERARLHAKIIESSLIESFALSRRLNTEKPSIWAVRGNTAAGKTYAVGHDLEFQKALDEEGKASGAINPDTFKAMLMAPPAEGRGLLKEGTPPRAEVPQFSHSQVHMEGSALNFQFAKALGKEAINATMIIDMRLAKHDQIKKEVIDFADIRNGDAMVMDIETPLITSINRVLIRDHKGADPIVPFSSIKQGYEDIRRERARVINEVQTNDRVKYFKFYINDEHGELKLAAKKEDGEFKVMPGMQEEFEKALQPPEADEVEKIVSQVIDEEYIAKARTRDHISQDQIHMIEQWKGYSVREALEKHNRGEKP